MPIKTKEKKFDWKDLVRGFVGDILERLEDNVSKKIHVFLLRLRKNAIGYVLMLVGLVFFSASLALLINFLLGQNFVWVGWGLVGCVVFWIGYRLQMQKK